VMMTIEHLSKFVENKRHLPAFPSWDELNKRVSKSTGELINALCRTQEEQALYIIQLNREIDEIKKRIK
jgi:hypothetical protein